MHTMNLKQLLFDEEAVSPVIGVILMVAITVILAAVIGTFVLGLGDQVSNTAPQASFTFDYTDDGQGTDQDSLVVTHNGGDSMEASALNASVSGATDSSGSATTFNNDLFASGDVTSGTSDTLNADDFAAGTLDLSGATVRIVWSEADSSATLGRWDGADA